MDYSYPINAGFTLICAIFVVLMQLGFAMLETGLNSHKNAANILFKNLIDFCIGAVVYYLIGYKVMFPERFAPGEYWGIPQGGADDGIKWFYQVAFAATATTIVSGAVAGRMRFKAYLLYTVFIAGVVYPLAGRFLWSTTGFYAQQGFHDFAGSIVVHGVGGMSSLAAVMVLRQREICATPGAVKHHNLSLAMLGCMILLVGWYGFNGGSIKYLVPNEVDIISEIASPEFLGLTQEEAAQLTSEERRSRAMMKLAELPAEKVLELRKSASEAGMRSLSTVVVNTTLGGACGAIVAMFAGCKRERKSRRRFLVPTAAINGCLAGLVSITANCDTITPLEAMLIGGVGGVLVLVGEAALLWIKKDDTVGAFPVHGLCGLWGGVAVGFFSDNPAHKLLLQTAASLVVLCLVFVVMLGFFLALKRPIPWLKWEGMEISVRDEATGLDRTEHNIDAYHPRLN